MFSIPTILILCCLTAQVFSQEWTKLSDGKCYAKVDDKKSWDDAKKYCKSKSAILATHPFDDASNINSDAVKYFGDPCTDKNPDR